MRLLDRYLTRELMIPLAYCLVGFLIFWGSFDWLAMAEDFQDAGMKLTACLYYYWIKLPEFISTTFPIALLIALLYTLTDLSRHHELVAIANPHSELPHQEWEAIGYMNYELPHQEC